MIARLAARGFLAIGPDGLEIDCAPLTLVIGPNAAGKTSLLNAALLLKQSAGELIKLDGPMLRARSLDDLHHGFTKDADLEVAVGWSGGDWPSPPATEACLALAESGIEWPPTRLDYRFRTRGSAERGWLQEIRLSDRDFLRVSRDPAVHGEPDRVELVGVGASLYVSDVRRVADARLGVRAWGETEEHERQRVGRMIDATHVVQQEIVRRLRDELHPISNTRGVRLMSQEVGPRVTTVGPYGEETLRLLSLLHSSGSPLIRRLTDWAERFGLDDLRAGWKGGNEIGATAGGYPIEFAASGSQKVLPILVALLGGPVDSTFVIEEPEHSLHPQWELDLAEMLGEAAAGGRQVIAETHSPTLVAAAAQLVRKGPLKSSDVAIWHLQRERASDGRWTNRAERIRVSPRGNLERWIPSYAAVERRLIDEWSQANPDDDQKSTHETPDRSSAARPGHERLQARGAGKSARRRG